MINNGFPGLSLPQVEENEVTLTIGDELIQTFLCTPEALEELAIGHLYCRGIIRSGKQILQIDISNGISNGFDSYEIRVKLNKKGPGEKESLEPFQLPSLTLLQNFADRIKNTAEKYRSHGGIHCAVLSDGYDIVALYEDVGRHNAFDKAIGAMVMKGIPPSGLIYFSSGRINSEIAEKAAACRLPLLVSRSIATTRACAISREFKIGIIGRIDSKAPIMYTACTRG